MSTIIITGYSGLLGKALLAELSGCGHELVCLGRAAPPDKSYAQHVLANLDEADNLAVTLPARADAVIHLAQAKGYNQFPERAASMFRVNVAVLAQLLGWGSKSGITHFIHASTGGVYAPSDAPLRETDPVALTGPLAYYKSTKRSAEMLAEPYTGKFIVAALRYFFIYGPSQQPAMLIPRLIASVREGRPLKLAGPDGIRFNPVHASDAAAATTAALALKQGGLFNIAGPEVLSFRAAGCAIGAVVGRGPVFEIGPAGHDLVADTARMRESLVAPRIGFADGIANLCGIPPLK